MSAPVRMPGATAGSVTVKNVWVGGAPQFMGDAVKPTDHGAIGVKDAAFIPVQRAHRAKGLSLAIRVGNFPADLSGMQAYFLLRAGIQRVHAFHQVKILDQRVVIKAGPAAVVLASMALKAILPGNGIIGGVHLFEKRGQSAEQGEIALSGSYKTVGVQIHGHWFSSTGCQTVGEGKKIFS